jgi:SAM-dependent methyltransferase
LTAAPAYLQTNTGGNGFGSEAIPPMKMSTHFTACVTALTATLAYPACAFAQVDITAASRTPDVIFVPTPQPVVDAMLKLANVQPGEMVYDLGCGDGRAVITAARDFGARGIGVDIDPERITESLANAETAGVSDRVKFKQEDLFTINFSDANVLFLYLLPELNVRLRPRILNELQPGTRVVSHAFTMGDWEADEKKTESGKTIFFWTVPAKVDGEWKIKLPNGDTGTLSLIQTYQKVTGAMKTKNKSLPVTEGRLKGKALTIAFGDGSDASTLTADVDGKQLKGTLQRGASGSAEQVTGEKAD